VPPNPDIVMRYSHLIFGELRT